MSTQFDYAKSAATALGLISKFGGNVVLKRRQTTNYNPTTSEAIASGVQETVKGAILPYAPYVIASSGGTIKQEDQRLMLAPQGIDKDPEPLDEVVVGNRNYTIVSVQKIAPSGVPVLYDMQVRR